MAEVAAPPGASPSPMVTPPTGPSPVAPPAQPGLTAAARAKMALGAQALIEALGIMKDVSTKEGAAIVDALKILAKVIPDAAEGLSQSALMGMQGAAPPVQQAPRPGMPGLIAPPRPAIVGGPKALPSMR